LRSIATSEVIDCTSSDAPIELEKRQSFCSASISSIAQPVEVKQDLLCCVLLVTLVNQFEMS